MIITEALQLNKEKPAILQLKNNEKNQIIAIGLKKGQVLKKHITAQPALLIVLKGLILFETRGSEERLPVLSTYDIPVNVPHEVKGLEESIFLIIKEKV